jgi:hypothetical protein
MFERRKAGVRPLVGQEAGLQTRRSIGSSESGELPAETTMQSEELSMGLMQVY